MQRLLEDAEKISGIEYDISSYADIVDAIHVVQTEMGITGTTAEEASTTIQGSLSSTKSAWENLLTGVADDDADFEGLVNNFVDSLVVTGENIIPRINTVIQGLTQLITQSSETIIPMVVETLIQNLPSIVSAGIDLVMALVDGILDNMDVLIDSAIELIDVVVDKLIENLPKLIDGGVRLIIALAGGLIKAIPRLVKKIPEIISALVDGLSDGASDILEAGKDVVRGIWDGIKSMGEWIGDKVTGFFSGVVDDVKDFLGIHSPSKVFAGIGGFMAEGLGVGFDDEFSDIKKNIEDSMNFDAGTISGKYEMSAYSSPVAISEQNRVFSLLEKYLPMLANMKIVLDGGTVVGILAPEIDSALGKINAREARAV